jgi:hypothetical protein
MTGRSRTPRGGMRHAWAIACIVCSLTVARAPAHIVYGSPSVYELVVDSDLVVRARIGDTPAAVDPSAKRPVVVAEVLDIYKGSHQPGTVRFAQHGHGVAPYRAGDEALLFLRRAERVRELDELAATGETAWVSLQEHDTAYTMAPADVPAFDAAVRAWVAAAAEPEPSARLASLRAVTVAQLTSAEPRLARSSLRDLVLMGGALVTADNAPALMEITDDPTIDIGIRLGVLTVLEQREMVEGPARWARLLQTTPAPDRLSVVRAAGAHPSPQVTAELVKLLEGDDAELAAAAAVSLGVPGNEAALAPLVRAATHGDVRVQMAAIRGLGRVATEAAQAALEQISEKHPEPAIRLRAGGEVARLSKLSP